MGGTRRQPALMGTFKTTLEGQSVSYALKRSPRARFVRFEVCAGSGLTVVVPSAYDLEQLPGLLKKKRVWILSKLRKYGKAQPVAGEKPLKDGDSLPYLGRQLKLVKRTGSGTESVERVQDRLVLNNIKKGQLDLILEGWYRQRADIILRKQADILSLRIGVTYARLTIRGARTRWGSCSRKGNLNFNWKLMMLPPPVIDYVIIHELAHLREMNHSKRFWSLVAEHCPDWRKCKQWLGDYGVVLNAPWAV